MCKIFIYNFKINTVFTFLLWLVYSEEQSQDTDTTPESSDVKPVDGLAKRQDMGNDAEHEMETEDQDNEENKDYIIAKYASFIYLLLN